MKTVFTFTPPDLVGMVQMIVSFAEKARREGLLSLEADVAEVDSEFMRKAIQLVVDGTDPELVRAILDTEIGNFEDRHSANKAPHRICAIFRNDRYTYRTNRNVGQPSGR